jgi:glycolate oxidase subunit GlcD
MSQLSSCVTNRTRSVSLLSSCSTLDKLVKNLSSIVGQDGVLSNAAELLVYECDGLPQHKYRPRAVVFPESTEETAEVMCVLKQAGVPFTPRGAGTGLSGGALALDQGVVIELARMRKVLAIDADNRTALVQTGVVNAHVSRAVAHLGLHYVPDPSSQGTCTIGGNIAESAGGIHCLKYGTTTDHVLGMKVVLAGGEIVELGGPTGNNGYDLTGVFVGSEGTFGIATEALLRLVPVPPGVRTLLAEFADVNDASHAVSAIIAAGVMPAALEMMDREIIRAVEASVFAAGLSLNIGAALLIELDGLEAGIDAEAERVRSICLAHRANNCRLARDEAERKKLWAARKGAFGAIGRIAPDSMIQDAVVPRSRLPEVMAEAYRISDKFQLRLANVFHAGDGNLHPFICFDSRSADQVRRVKEAGRELMETCVRAGGTITGEHGVGFDKRDFLPLIFSADDMEAMLSVRRAFDPDGLCNPGKIIPMLKGCGEARAVLPESSIGSRASRPQQRGPASLNDSKIEWSERQSLSAGEGGKAASLATSSFNGDEAALKLSAIVGEGSLSAPASPRQSVSHPESQLIVSAGSIGEICEVVKLAAREGWTVVPAGARSWLGLDNPLKTINVVLKTSRMNRLINHEPADLVASAEAGLSLSAFNEAVNRGGQWLPLDPPDKDQATLGGVVATGMKGAQASGYGSPRTFVIGMKVVLPDGRVCKFGGRVVKNVAGYDLCKLFTGSYGTLGVICELTFKLRPRPAKEATIRARGSLRSAFVAGWSVYQAGLFPVAIELVTGGFTANECSSADTVELLIRFAGIEKTVEHQLDKGLKLIKDVGLSEIETVYDDESLWRNIQAAPLDVSCENIYRLAVKPSELLQTLEEIPDSVGRESAWQAGVADGRIRLLQNTVDAQKLRDLRGAVERKGGSLVIERASGDLANEFNAWGTLPEPNLMQRIKYSLDPADLFAPGRFED